MPQAAPHKPVLDPAMDEFYRSVLDLADYGAWAMSGWHQVFFYDPEGNVIEVHQVRS